MAPRGYILPSTRVRVHTFLERDSDTTHTVDAPGACMQGWRASSLPLSDSRVWWKGVRTHPSNPPPGYGPGSRVKIALIMYGVSAPSLHRESTDSLDIPPLSPIPLIPPSSHVIRTAESRSFFRTTCLMMPSVCCLRECYINAL